MSKNGNMETKGKVYPGVVMWGPVEAPSLGVVVLPKGEVSVIDCWDGKRVEVPSRELREVGSVPKSAARVHPYADVFECLQKRLPMEGARAARFQELCLKLFVVWLYPKHSEDLKGVFTPEQLRQCNEEVMAFANVPLEQLLHLALYGHVGPRAGTPGVGSRE